MMSRDRKKVPSKRWKFQIFYLVTDNQFENPKKCIEVASLCCPKKFAKPVVRPMFEVQYYEFMRKLSRLDKYIDDTHNVMIFLNDRYILMNKVLELLKAESCPAAIITQSPIEPSWTRNLFDPSLVSPERDYIFFNIHLEGKHYGNLIFEIFTDINPKVSKSFVELFNEEVITIGHYHVFKDGWLEFGIGPRMMPSRGHNHHPIMSHNRRGILSFCQEFNLDCDPFFIHFVPCTFFDSLRTVLGRVIHGEHTLTRIEQLETEFGKIETEFSIHSCGVVPIGRNVPQNIDYKWHIDINSLFENVGGEPTTMSDQEVNSEIICPMSQTTVGETMDTFSEETISFSTPQTIESWNDFDLAPLTFFYKEDTNTSENLTEQSSLSQVFSEPGEGSVKSSYFHDDLSLAKESLSESSLLDNADYANETNERRNLYRKKDCPSLGFVH